MKFNKHISITIVCIILGITLAWQYQSIRNNSKAASLDSQRREQLVEQLLQEKNNNENLRKKNDELNMDLSKLENARGDYNESMKLLKNDIDKYKMIAGMTEVKGKGVTITFSKDDAEIVQDIDILDVLNDLRASDAQAIAINDERVIATTEVRVAGNHIMVNGKQVTPPYVIKAIADPANVDNAFHMIGGVIEKLKAYQLSPTIEKSENIVIPKVRDEVIRYDMLTPVEK